MIGLHRRLLLFFFSLMVLLVLEAVAAFERDVTTTEGFGVDFANDDGAETPADASAYPEGLAVADAHAETCEEETEDV